MTEGDLLVIQWKGEERRGSGPAHPAGSIDLPFVDALRKARSYDGGAAGAADGTWGCWTFSCSNLVCTLADSCTAIPTYDTCAEV